MTILLSTLNARYHHASLALRYLFANMGDLQEQTKIREFTLAEETNAIVESLLAHQPKIIGLGIYIWNARQSLDLVKEIKRKSPQTLVILGGPEVSFDVCGEPPQAICQLADCVIQGEADLAFADACRCFLNERPVAPVIKPKKPDIHQLQSPYRHYSDQDIAHRIIYVEASRGCPYTCEFCLSSLDENVRNFRLEFFLEEMQHLLDRGVRQFKFIDRTFNLSPTFSAEILTFFLDRIHLGLFLHFELVPDRLPDHLKTLIRNFPPGSLQFEIGIQTLNVEVAKLIRRKQNYLKTKENLEFLVNQTAVHIHADLIAGLPGENEKSFAEGFDQLFSFNPHEIQVGILKRLKGTPIVRHDAQWKMVYGEDPPFEILETLTMDRASIQRIKIFSKFWDKIANSGRFGRLMEVLRARSHTHSTYAFFMQLSLVLFEKFGRTHSIPLDQLIVGVGNFLSMQPNDTFRMEPLENFLPKINSHPLHQPSVNTPKRQSRHVNASEQSGQGQWE